MCRIILLLSLATAVSLSVITCGVETSEIPETSDNVSCPPQTRSLILDTQGFSRTYGGTGSDSACALVQTYDGGYAVAGNTQSFGAGSYDFWFLKTDANGNMEWNKTYGGKDYDYAEALVATADGGYAIAGYTTSFGTNNLGDFWLVKTDESGNMQWNRTYGGSSNAYPSALVETSDGGYALAGGTLLFDAHRGGKYDFWLVKTDSMGNHLWNKTYGKANEDNAAALVETSDGGYAIVGSTQSDALAYDFWLVKTDAAGNEQWNTTIEGVDNDHATALVETNDGGYAIAGYTLSFGIGGDFWLVKTDPSGNVQWNKTYGGSNREWAYALVKTSDGGYALAGEAYSFGAGNNDFWLVKTDASGNAQWSKTYGGANWDCAYALAETSDRGYTIAGETWSYGLGAGDCWLIKIDENGVIPEFPSALMVFILLATLSFAVAIATAQKRMPGFRNRFI